MGSGEARPSIDHDAETPVPVPKPAGETDLSGATSLPVPDRIGHYTIKRCLASGGMGVVYVAVQEQPRRTVALKVMKPGLTSPAMLRRFEYEAQILARLRHPNIAGIYEAGTHDGGAGPVPFFAMEYVPNARTVTEYAVEERLTTRERLDLFSKVCEAVHHGHQKGIIHRDLKPGNILVDSTGEPKIIDFGVARATDSDMAITTLQTDVGQLIGTLQYMSPEQCIADPHDLDTRSDVYSLGVVLYELLCERLPYVIGKAAIHEAARVLREEAPARPSTISRTLAGDIETITLKALEKSRKRRYASAAAFAQDIRHYLNKEPIEARPPSMMYQIRMFSRRHRPTVIATGVVLVAIVGGLVLSLWGLGRAQAAKVEANEARQAAEDDRDEAQRYFETLRDLTTSYVLDVDPAIEREGLIHARLKMVEDGVRAADVLAAARPDDMKLKAILAAMYERLGNLQGGLRGARVEDIDEALESQEKALTLRKDLYDQAPSEDTRQKLAVTHIYVGDVHLRRGKHEEALTHYEQAFGIRQQVYLKNRSDPEALENLAVAELAIGSAYDKMGETDLAVGHYRSSLKRRRDLSEQDPDDVQALRNLSVALIRVGSSYEKAGQLDEALEQYRDAVRIRQRLAEPSPPLPRARRDLMQARYQLAYALFGNDQTDEALEHLQACVATGRALCDEDPGDQRAADDLLNSFEACDAAYTMLDRWPDALSLRREMLAWRQSRSDAQPEDRGRRLETALAQAAVGEALCETGDRSEAIDAYRAARDLLKKLGDAEPEEQHITGALATVETAITELMDPGSAPQPDSR